MDPSLDLLTAPELVAATPPHPDGASAASAAEHPAKPRRTWVPVRSLTSRHRDRIAAHLLALDEHDRYLRFGYGAADAQISHYADSIDFERDEVFGIFNRRLELIAMAHLAYASTPQIGDKAPMAEFGVSVLRSARARGLGGRLFDHAVLHARNRHIQTLFIHALSENTAMLKIASSAGAKVEREGPEAEAWLSLPLEDLRSQVGAMVEEQAAELDYQLKVQAKRVHEFIEAISEVKSTLSNDVRSPHE